MPVIQRGYQEISLGRRVLREMMQAFGLHVVGQFGIIFVKLPEIGFQLGAFDEVLVFPKKQRSDFLVEVVV